MNVNQQLHEFSRRAARMPLALSLFRTSAGILQADIPFPGSYTNTALDFWSFTDTTNWTSDFGSVPIAFSNLKWSILGDGTALVIDSTNPAFLNYNTVEPGTGATNFTVDAGSVMFWVAPTSWSGTNEGGTGPGEWGRLLELGQYTSDASYGWFSLYVDDVGCNLYFSGQTNDGTEATFLVAPIEWTSNRWHQVALTWSATNSALYIDGWLITNGLPVTCYPDPDVLTNGFFIGSDSSGGNQAHAMFDDVATYSYLLDDNTVELSAALDSVFYWGDPDNAANILPADTPNPSPPPLGPIAGTGFFPYATNTPGCETNSTVWITNVVATTVPNGTRNLIFTIAGGYADLPYDVYAATNLTPPKIGNSSWAWIGQGYSCNTYLITNLPATCAFLILGTPEDSDGDGLTDAFELLVSHTNSNLVDSNGNGISDGDELSPNGLPWRLVEALQSSAIIVADVPGHRRWLLRAV